MAKVKFGNVVKEYKGKIDQKNNPYEFYVAGDHMDTDDLTIRRRGRFATDDVGPAFIREFKKGQVLYGSRRTYLRKIAVADFDGVTANTTFVLETKDESILRQRLLPFIMYTESFTEWSIKKSKGSTNPYVLFKDLADYEFELPDIGKQDELVELLWSMIDTRDAYNNLIVSIDELVKSQFIERFGDPITNPKGWPVMQLQDIVSDDCSISYGIVKPGDDVPDGVPVFRPVDIVGKKPEITELKRTSKAISDQYKRTLLTGRELLLTVRANIGDTCIIGDEFKGCNVGRGIVPIRVKEDLMSLEFLKCQMDFDTMHDYIQSLSKGITLIQLNMEDLRKIAFIVPPVDLQKEYLSIVRQSDKSKFTVGRRFKSQFIERFEGQGYAVVKAKTFMTNMRNGVSPSKKGLHAEKVLTLSAVTQGAFDPEAWKDGIFDECPPADKRIHTSEFYMCRGNGNKMLVGTAVFSPEDHDDLVFPDTVIAAHIDSNIILLPYLFVAWKMPSVRKQIEENARTTNGTYKINQTVLSNIELIVPPLEKQNEFVSFVEQSDKSKLSVQNKLSAFRRLTYRILQFEGGLRNV